MTNPLKIQQLQNSLYTGFIDQEGLSLEKYRPKLLVNNHKEGQKVLTNIINELNHCDEFFFSVAFITYSGVLVLLNTLKELEERGVKGKIIASQYLNFTDPEALLKLLSFDNIELRMVVDEDLHSKGYIFRKDDEYNLIVGSSNLTQNGDVAKGLVFCSRNDEARELSNAFNRRGYRTLALSGSNTQDEREAAVERLESDESDNHLDYIFTVDIFNDDCETLGHTTIFKTNAADFKISRICFKYFLFFLHRSI